MRDHPTKFLIVEGEIMNPLRQAISDRLSIERCLRGMRHKDFYALLGEARSNGNFSYNTYSRAMRLRTNLTIGLISSFADALDISVSDFLFGAEAAPDWTRQFDLEATLGRLATRLEDLRLSSRLNHQSLIERICSTTVTYARLKTGKHNVSIDTIAVIATAFDLTPTEFLYTAPLRVERTKDRASDNQLG